MKIVGKTQSDLDLENKKKDLECRIIEAKEYLAFSDKYVVREYETGEPMYEAVKKTRIECKQVINSNTQQLKDLNK